MINFGVTIYPELWSKEYIEKAFTEIKESGFDIIRFGEMSWGNLEVEDGRFHFGFMDEAMDLAQKNGLKVLLGIGTSQAPQWLIKKYPEILPIANDGTKHPAYGPRPNVCRDNQKYRRFAERYIRKMAKRYKKHPALFAWQLDNEPLFPPLDLVETKDFCHCDATKEAFRAWAKEKYKTIEEVNKAWGTSFWGNTFSSFDEVTPPPSGFWDAGNPHIYLDWFRYKSESIRDFLSFGKKLIKNEDKEHDVGSNGFTSIPTRIPDHDVVAEPLDWFGWDIYPKGTRNNPQSLAQIADYWRSLTYDREGKFYVLELQGGPNVRWGYPGQVNGKEMRMWMHQMAAHGASAILFHTLRPHMFGSETGGFGILKYNGERTDRLETIEKTIIEIKELSKALEEHKIIPQIAIGYLKNSEIESFQEQGPNSARGDVGLMHGLNSIAGAHMILWGRENPVAFIFDRHLESNIMSRTLLLTNPYLLKQKHSKVLKKFLYDGGTLITEARFGLKDENGQLYEKPLLEYLFEVEHEYTELIEDSLKLKEIDAKAYGFRDIIKVGEKDKVLLTFEDGKPAAIEKKIGKGKAVYFTFNVFLSVFKGGNEKLSDFVHLHVPVGDIKVTGPKDVEVVTWLDTTPLLYIINHSSEAKKISLELASRLIKAIDPLTKKEHEINGGKITLELKGAEIKLLHLLEK